MKADFSSFAGFDFEFIHLGVKGKIANTQKHFHPPPLAHPGEPPDEHVRRCEEYKNEFLAFIYSQIAQLGVQGWEMVTAPNLNIPEPRFGKWLLWFKRPFSN